MRGVEIMRGVETLKAHKKDGTYKIFLMHVKQFGSVSETHTVASEIEFKTNYKLNLEHFGNQLGRPPEIHKSQNKESFKFTCKAKSSPYSFEAILDYEMRDELCAAYVETRRIQIICADGETRTDSSGTGFEATVKDEGHLHIMIQDGVVIETRKSFTLKNYNQTKNDLEAELNHSPIRILKEHEEVPMLKWDDILIGGVAIRFIVKLANSETNTVIR